MARKLARALSEVQKLERLAEAAYAGMYELESFNVKDCYEDAQVYFRRAIETARSAGLDEEANRLTLRKEHVVRVYNSQFRHV